jgi:hypothetical protein
VGRLYLYLGVVVSKQRVGLPNVAWWLQGLVELPFLAAVRQHGRVRVPDGYPGVPRALGPVCSST